MIGQTISHYRILSKLGDGAMGVVYLAEDTFLGRRVAIKTLTTEPGKLHFQARFLREARAASAISHPNIATVHDFGETPDGRPYIVMELVDGQNLSNLITGGALTLSRAVEIIEGVAGALAEAHRHGIIHRDIKPSNVAVNERGEVKVLDFGLAKYLNGGGGARGDGDEKAQELLATQTREGVIIGTPLYLSPEQALGAPVDARSDIFSLGSLLYECITGRPAFFGVSVIAICAKVIRDDPPPPSELNRHVPPELDRITLKALAKKTEERYQSADELRADLRALRPALSDSNHVKVPKRAPSIPTSPRLSALTMLADTLQRPRVLAPVFLAALVVALLTVWSVPSWFGEPPYEPTPEAKRWYDRGTEALRNGSYHAASKMLEEAIKADDDFALAHARLAEAWTELDYTDKAKDEIIRIGQLVTERSKLPPLEALYLDAITNTVTRDFAKAIENYRQIEQRVTDAEKPAAYLDLGRAYEKNEEIDKAIEGYREATRRDRQYAAAFLRLGIAYGRKQDLANADAAFDEAHRLYQTLNDIEGVTEVLYQRGSLLNKVDKIAAARPQLDQALGKARATGNRSQQILTLLQLSSVAFGEGSTRQAQEYAQEAVNLAQAGDMENLTTRGLIDLGNAFFAKGSYGEAEEYFKQALGFAGRYKGRRNEARALFMLGSLRINQGRTDEGVHYVQQASDFYEQGGYRKEASQALMLIGRANRDKGNYDAALRAYKQLLQRSEQIEDHSQVALSHKEIGIVLARYENYPEALRHSQSGYNISKSLGNQQGMSFTLPIRGDMLWRLGRYEEAREALSQAVSLVEQSGGSNKAVLLSVWLTGAYLMLSERDFSGAKAKSQQILVLTDKSYEDVATEAKFILGLAEFFSGSKRKGKQLCEEAVAMAELSRDQWRFPKAMLALAEVALESGDTEKALITALQAQESFARSGRQDSEWRAWLIAARASRRAGDEPKAREYGSRAANLFSNLRQQWGEAYNGYFTRPDVQHSRKQLNEVIAENE